MVLYLEGQLLELRIIVGWVERQGDPTNAPECWVSLPQPNLRGLLFKA